MAAKAVLIPLPDKDFDVTEVSVPWHILTSSGISVKFATEGGSIPECDPLLITGVLCGKLGADREPLKYYEELTADDNFNHPIKWADIIPEEYNGLMLPGGHAKGMRQYLGSQVLHEKVSAFWELNRPVAAICHGPLVLARAKNPKTQKSLLHERQTMALPKYMERLAFFSTCLCRGGYYRTYPMYVEDEIKSVMKSPTQFRTGRKSCFGLAVPARGTSTDDKPAEIIIDGNYVSARWPGDAYMFGRAFLSLLQH